MYNDLNVQEQRSKENITSSVKKFYEEIQFPGNRPMEQDSLIFFRKFSKLIDRVKKSNQTIRVLDAGCGTGNTSLALAAQFPNVQFTGIDISSTSIQKAKNSLQEKDLKNLKFHEWNLMKIYKSEYKFEIILCFGVLHHTAEMQKVLNNLSTILNSNGILFLWVYGKYGRYFHSLNVELLSLLLTVKRGKETPIEIAKDFILNTQNGIIVKDLLKDRSEDQMLKQFYNDTTWIADQFLNPNELLVTIKDLINLTKNSDLKINEWIGVSKDTSKFFNSQKLENLFEMLSPEKQMIALDLLLKMERYFLVLKKNGTL